MDVDVGALDIESLTSTSFTAVDIANARARARTIASSPWRPVAERVRSARLTWTDDVGTSSDPLEVITAVARLVDAYRTQAPAWHRRARCVGAPVEMFFPGAGSSSASAKALCHDCEVRRQCLAYALDHGPLLGIWGGTSEAERRRMLMRGG